MFTFSLLSFLFVHVLPLNCLDCSCYIYRPVDEGNIVYVLFIFSHLSFFSTYYHWICVDYSYYIYMNLFDLFTIHPYDLAAQLIFLLPLNCISTSSYKSQEVFQFEPYFTVSFTFKKIAITLLFNVGWHDFIQNIVYFVYFILNYKSTLLGTYWLSYRPWNMMYQN